MTNTLTRLFTGAAATVAALLLGAVSVFAQIAPTQTTLSSAITTTTAQSMIVASATGFNTTDTPIGEKVAMIDRELIRVRSVSSTTIQISRGWAGSSAATHASGATVTVSNPAAFRNTDTSSEGLPTAGSCTAGNELYLPVYNYLASRRWNCVNSTWMVDNGYAFLGPSACQSSVSGNSSGTNGLTVIGTAPSYPVIQASTSATGTNTHYYVCNLNQIGAGTSSANGRQTALIDVVAFYGVQTTGLGTQVATLASGTMNSQTVFTSILHATPGASETAQGITQVARADSGSLTITPAVASFNVATTTAGQFYSARFTPASAIAMATDLKQYFFTFSLLNTATSATVTNLLGVIVHYAYIPD